MLGASFSDSVFGVCFSPRPSIRHTDISALRTGSIKREITHNRSRLPINPDNSDPTAIVGDELKLTRAPLIRRAARQGSCLFVGHDWIEIPFCRVLSAAAKNALESVQRQGPAYDQMPSEPISGFIASDREFLRIGGEMVS